MFGGILFGHIADKFGRRPVMLLTLYMPIFVGVGTAFAPWYSLFAVLRFIQGVLIQGLQTSTYTLAMEMFLPKYWSHVGVLFECINGFGILLLSPLAYLIQDWRYLQLATCLPSLFAFGYICIMPESLRWLIMMGKLDEAEALITKIAEKNKLPYPHESWKDVKFQLETRDTNTKQYSFIDLMRTPVLRKRSLILFYIWFATSLGYYGLTWNLTELAGNKYLNFFIGGAVEFVSYVLVLPVTKRFGRRRPLCFYFLSAAATCITAGGLMFQPYPSEEVSWAATAFAITGKFGMCGVFCVIAMYTSELYPTVIRNIGIGSCSFWTRLGGVIAPQVLLIDQTANQAVPLILFGIVTLLGGILTMLLPETRDHKIPDTVEDVEKSSSSIAEEQCNTRL
ncbi:hypothetical protein CHS0354_041488 [Potamilus streckersoni]|uniref:Major facilitator superfamily (MFS) profile domain-containing protein n=1 Tax=Potamilus streckersoni TaxID=2493646 RepID=A0AAE0TA20_9BIVA|nr:hypothetical protein CHS0354_041488 [Potamilus streckersoni]